MADVHEYINKGIELPAAPTIITQLTSLLNKEDIGSHELAEVAQTDQAFTAKILKLVNSPFYGFSREVYSVEEAITMIGLEAVHHLLLTMSFLNIFKTDKNIFNINEFWLHSLSVGIIAKELIKNETKEIKNAAYLSGILHDVGRLIYYQVDPKKYAAFYDHGASVIDLEKETKWFQLNHQQIGSLLGEKWNFPNNIVSTIKFHHSPDEYKGNDIILVHAVHIGDIISHGLNIGNSGITYVTKFSKISWNALQLTDTMIKNVIKSSIYKIEHIKEVIFDNSDHS